MFTGRRWQTIFKLLFVITNNIYQVKPTSGTFSSFIVSDLICSEMHKQLKDSKTIGIILYSEEFKIVNPISASKSNHKLMGFYTD